MVHLHIVTDKADQVKEIVEILINNNLISHATVIDSISNYKSDNNGGIEIVKTNLILCVTSTTNYSSIERILIEKYADASPQMYGMPVLNMNFMNWEQSQREL